MAATQIEALPSKIQNKLFYVGLGLIPVAFIYVGLHFLSGSQEARMKLTGVIIGAVLILGATAIVATLKSVIGQ